ncbi:hypothetical protein QBC46DRAFT_342078 [Diplogelasinospora grovesii]|uniref:CENP-V/GFA domain-containing protein n=1 Tax=Diplogelasinospora grovesii TaxID=303347 RepID=A0AAN6S4W2_9PEZI|nr:hypothetical protein QBC46DRAFT_342078 [Diplogelasinospora grovesii]
MSFERPLRGGCHCGRNRYIIQFPSNSPLSGPQQRAQVLFNSHPSQRIFQASPLAAFLRVPLEWYHSTTFAFFPDETSSMIHRVYTPPHEQHAMRHFCGFCGTPLSYWSEEPRSEADFIQLTLGSLSPGDLADLEDLGFLPSSDDEGPETPPRATSQPRQLQHQDTHMSGAGSQEEEEEMTVTQSSNKGREIVGGLPWFDTLVEGSKLGNMRTVRGQGTSRDGSMRVEWEVVEWTAADDEAAGGGSPRSIGKRKFGEREDSDIGGGMEGVLH